MRTIAFYLPQFHRIAENDAWWGEGFTEWVNVRRARPNFDGHLHPRIAGNLGEYDLTDSSIHTRQTALAREAGVDAFCMYFYWFDGRRLLERPVEAWRQSPDLLPYCLSWANESWTRRWDGKERDVLMPQSYQRDFVDQLFAELLPHFRAPHYLRQHGMPVLVVHRADLIPDVRSVARELRERALQSGFPGIHLIAAETKPGIRPQNLGFDAVAEFPPVGANTLSTAQLLPVPGVRPDFRGRLMSYDKLCAQFEARREPRFVRYRGVAPGWDNTARRQTKATVYAGSSPARYARWLTSARTAEERARGTDGLIFINAWNEWAEGAYLEPDAEFGDAYLRATADPLAYAQSDHLRMRRPRVLSRAQLRSIALAAAGSVLAAKRGVLNAIPTRK